MKKLILLSTLFLFTIFSNKAHAMDNQIALMSTELLLATGVLFASTAYADFSMHREINTTTAMLNSELKKKLDEFFTTKKAQKSINNHDTFFQQTKGSFWRDALPAKAILQELNFTPVGNSKNPSVFQHTNFNNIFFKLNSNNRFKTAQTIQTIITTLDLQNVIIPKKWLYRIPKSIQDLVVVETIEQDFHNPKLDNKHHNELAIIMTVLDNLGIPFTDTLPKKENIIKIALDKVAIIDTESWTDRSINGYRVNFLGQNKSNLQTFLDARKLTADLDKISEINQYFTQQQKLPKKLQTAK